MILFSSNLMLSERMVDYKQGRNNMLNPGEMINDTYIIDSIIGSGSLGVIYRAYHVRLQIYVCLKRIKMDKVSPSKVRLEVDTLKSLKSEYLPKVYDFIQYKGEYYTVMDYISGKDLKYYIENRYQFSEEDLVKWLRQICSVLLVIHKHNPIIVHSDIKPDNIIINDEGNAFLIDFNIAGGQGLTKEYASPEQYTLINMINSGAARIGEYAIDGRSDIYSLGITMYQIITGILPYVNNNGIPKLTSYKGLPYSDAFLEIIDKMTEWDLDKRFASAEEVLAAADRMKYSNSRYKRYIFFQIITAMICLMLLVTGVWMIIQGGNDVLVSDFQKDYHTLIGYYEKNDYRDVEKKGYEIINSSRYKELLTDAEICKIFHMMGNSKYNNGDYLGASVKLGNAMKYESDYEDKASLYADYSIALVKVNKPDDAVEVLNKASQYGINDPGFILTEAEIAYRNNDFNSALEKAVNCLNQTVDNSKKARCYTLLGDIYNSLKNNDDSIKSYKNALACNETPDTIRKYTAVMTLKSQSFSSDDAMRMDYIRKAEAKMRKIYTDYEPQFEDYINLGILNNSLENYDFAIRVLNDGIKAEQEGRITPGVNKYKLFLYLAIVYKDMGKIDETIDYASRAMQLCTSVDKNDDDYKKLKSIFEAYS